MLPYISYSHYYNQSLINSLHPKSLKNIVKKLHQPVTHHTQFMLHGLCQGISQNLISLSLITHNLCCTVCVRVFHKTSSACHSSNTIYVARSVSGYFTTTSNFLDLFLFKIFFTFNLRYVRTHINARISNMCSFIIVWQYSCSLSLPHEYIYFLYLPLHTIFLQPFLIT